MLIGILKGTPWWVFVLFGYLVMKGINALKPRVISLKKLFILPIVFTIWGLYSLIAFKLNDLGDFSLWLAMMMLGSFGGYLLTRSTQIQADKKKNLIALPGTPSTLILSLAIFATKYFFGFFYATHPMARQNPVIISIDLISSGIMIGLFFGRAFCYWNLFRKAEQVDLIERK